MDNKFNLENQYNSKFSNVLTIILVIAIVGVVALLGVWGYQTYQNYALVSDAEQAIEEFDSQFSNNTNTINENEEENAEKEHIYIENPYEQTKDNSTTSTKNTSNSNNKTSQKRMYKGFVMTGYIEIPKTKVKLPILESVSAKALEKAVAILAGPGLNKPGNTVIIGHNYRNGTLFSKNDKLVVGDIVYITDETGTKYKYSIYDKYETTPEDSDYITRETEGIPEISLSSCNDDSSKRIIILARAE